MGQHTPPQVKARGRRKLAPTPRLKAGVIRVIRPDGVYIGTNENALILAGTGAAAVTALLDGSHSRLDIAVETGTPKERIDFILGALDRAGLIDRDFEECAFTPTIAERMAPELAAISHQAQVADGGAALLAARQQWRVDVRSGDRIGMTIATALAASGVGQVTVIDDGSVTPVDVIGTAIRFSDVGAEKTVAAHQRIKEAMPVDTGHLKTRADFVVLTRPPLPDEVMLWGLADTPHLVVQSEPDSAVIGPLVVPGKSACTRCIALHRVDRDRHWGAVEMTRLRATGIPSALGALVAAASACTQILSYIDTQQSAAIDATLHLSLRDGFIRPRTWRAHPLCGCGWN